VTEPLHRSRRDFIGAGAATAAAVAVLGPRVLAQSPFDLLLRGATIVDGTGAPPFPADLAIAGDRIAALGTIAPEQARRAIDVSGLHVAPGFVDIHTHSDGGILRYPTADSRVRQGVTTEVTGNCGSSAAPIGARDLERERRELQEDGIELTWTGVASYCDVLDRAGLSVNHAPLVGQGTLRRNAIGVVDRALTAEEMTGVLRSLEEALEQGAFGLSTGLEYTPGRYTPTSEIVTMARVVARYGGLYASHIRDEESLLLEAVDEAIGIGRESGARVQVSHLKAAGQPNWSKQQGALDLIASARRDGVMVLADAYPYTAYSTTLTVLLSGAALEGGMAGLLPRLRDPEWRERIRREVTAKMASELGDYALLVVARVTTPANQPVVGRNIVEIAKRWNMEPLDAVLRLIEEEEGSVSIIGHGMSPANVEKVLGHPLVMIGSDGSSMAPVGRAAASRPHPRSYGTFARVLGHYVRERKLFSLAEAVKKMTSLPADQVGLRDRGRIARGLKADLVVFDAATVKDEATFDSPHQYASGMPLVIVNGVAVVERGQHTGAKPGRALRRG
jgi:N-acyl-D-amino-acid deacylase